MRMRRRLPLITATADELSGDDPPLQREQVGRFILPELRRDIVDNVGGGFARHRTFFKDREAGFTEHPDIIAVPKPVDVLPAAVERTPLRVVVFQEIETGKTAVRTGIMVAVVDRV